MFRSWLVVLFVGIAIGVADRGGWGPEKVAQRSGYITVNTKVDNGGHIFYWMFESRSDPKNDPVILWMTGGPGCSSMLAAFYENGPYMFPEGPTKDLKQNLKESWSPHDSFRLPNDVQSSEVSLNPYSWNEVANIIYVDQPVGTGFSYADRDDDYVRNEEQVAEDMYEFLQQFFKENPQFKNSRFFVTGESYGGHYVPAVANRVWKGNQLKEEDQINLQGAAIGNGFVNARLQFPEYINFLKAKKVLGKTSLEIVQLETEACVAALDNNNPAALELCEMIISTSQKLGNNFNVYDIRKKCITKTCYDFSSLDELMVSQSVHKALGISPKANWEECNMEVYLDLANDWLLKCDSFLVPLLEDNIPVLIYSGNQDFICNSFGARAWTKALKWKGSAGFNSKPEINYELDGAQVGQFKSFQNLTFLEIYDAGHMVPMDKPHVSLAMMKSFVNGHFGSNTQIIPEIAPVEFA